MGDNLRSVYWFSEINKNDVGRAGGKGANLGELYQMNMPVPAGFIVVADAYFHFIESAKIGDLINDLIANLDVSDNDKLTYVSDQIKEAILTSEMPQETKNEIKKSYSELCSFQTALPTMDGAKFVAVRSSATAEDLPEASFAGQQATFLNVKGADELVDAVRKCWASLFEPRAIYYRAENGFNNVVVGIAVVVQEMVQSDVAGVMFTVDPMTNDRSKIIIEGAYGLGELVVSGSTTPDHYVVRKSDLGIISKEAVKQPKMIVKINGKNELVDVPEEKAESQKLTDLQIGNLARMGREIESHYGKPQDIEWATSSTSIYIVQSRPVTTLKAKEKLVAGKKEAQMIENAFEVKPVPLWSGQLVKTAPSVKQETNESEMPNLAASLDIAMATPLPAAVAAGVKNKGGSMIQIENAQVILKGNGASPGVAHGRVQYIASPKEIGRMEPGCVLVTEMTTPDFVPAMKKAIAIVTDAGGATCHAAIVSRELGIPCIVGTQNATRVLQEGEEITVDAVHGIVYEGNVAIEAPAEQNAPTEAACSTFSSPICGTKIYVNLAEPDIAERVAKLPVDGVGLMRAEFIINGIGVHPKKMVEDGRSQEYVDKLAEGMRKIAAAFYPRPVVYRATDFKTNEYRNLEGGEKYEPSEANPMMGYRGCSRYIIEEDLFKLELDAIKKVRETYGLKNLWLMIPFVRKIGEIRAIKEILKRNGIHFTKDFKLWIMVEVPSTVFMIEEFCKEGIHGISIGSNDLTQLILGIDRDNATMADAFDERNLAVMRAIKQVVEVCNKYGVTTSICGQAPSVYPEFAQDLVEFGINSISVNPDSVEITRRNVASAEQKLILKKLLDISKATSSLKEGDAD